MKDVQSSGFALPGIEQPAVSAFQHEDSDQRERANASAALAASRQPARAGARG